MSVSLILVNGKIYTMDGKLYEAVAISQNRIYRLGKTADVINLRNKKTEVYDLQGKTVLPGFIDTHAHLAGYGRALQSADLNACHSLSDIISSCRKHIRINQFKFGQWLIGRGWNQEKFITEKRFPNRFDLDQVSDKHPILLLRVCGHIGAANSKALDMVKIKGTTRIEGGIVDLDHQGNPNGIIREAALEWFKKQVSDLANLDSLENAITRGANELLQYGITSVHTEDSYDLGHSGIFQDIYDTYQNLKNNGKLPIRIYQKVSLPHKENLLDFLAGPLRTGHGDSFYKIGPVKQWCDGTVGARTAALLKPYSDQQDNSGLLLYTKKEIIENTTLAHTGGMQVCLHAIGDAALDMVITAYEHLAENYRPGPRHRIVHCQVGNPSLYNRLAKLNVSINIQAAQTASDWVMMDDRLGSSRSVHCHNWRTLTDLGVCITGGSDIPVETPDVFYGIYAAVTRKDNEGNPPQGWLPQQKLTVEEAIKSYTSNAAWAAHEEEIKGTIKEGKLADLVVVNRDPFKVEAEELKKIKAYYVFIDGILKFSRNPL